jgi:manganese efflux pump family protein
VSVGFATVITWSATVLMGLYMLAVWLIENDLTSRGSIPSRLPIPVIFGHLLLAAGGLTVWVAFLILERKTLAWTAVGILVAIAVLGATMFLRWIPVYREDSPPPRFPGDVPAVRPEGNFPVAVVAAHGLLAVSTLVLALITALS